MKIFCLLLLIISLVFGSLQRQIFRLRDSEIIENFDSGVIELLSYPNEDMEPDAWNLDSTNTYNNSRYSLKLFGNTWKLELIDPVALDTNDVWQVAVDIEQLGEISGFGLLDSSHTLFYSFAGTEQLNIENWVTVYQGAFPLATWNIYQLPVGKDWLNWFGYLPVITGIVFINDRDTDTNAVVYFDEIIDITDDLPLAPQVKIWDSIGEIFVNLVGKKSVTVQFYSRVIDPDSDWHEYFWYFGDDSTSNDSNPIHTYLIEDNHEYTVLLEVVDSTGLWGRATCRVSVDPGPTTFPLTMNFIGDIMLARRYEMPGGIIDTLGVEGIFEPTLPYLGKRADLTVANLESPLTNQGTRHPTKPIVFRGRPENVAGLVYAGIDVVSLANNHIIDYGLLGLRKTQSVLAQNGILYSGAGANSYEAYLPLFKVKSGVNIGFLAFSDRTGQYNNYQPYLNAGFNKPGFANLDTFYLVQEVRRIENDADLIVVQMHSGSEYSLTPRIDNSAVEGDEFFSPQTLIPCTSDVVVRHRAIDAGADLVVCHHPHIIQGFEVYQNKLIAHSLGNFTFDLDFPETYPSVILNAKINETGFYDYSITPIYIDDYIPVRAKGKLGLHILDYLARRSRELNTYLLVEQDSVIAQIVLDTMTLTPFHFVYDDSLSLREVNSYWISHPLKLKRNGSISSILTISPFRNWQVRLGRDLTWFWCGNFENEGSSLWLINEACEFYDTLAFEGFRSLCQRHAAQAGLIITNLEERIVCYSDSIPYTLYGYIKTQNSDSAGIQVRFYRSRTSGYNGSNDLDTIIARTSDWAFYYNEFIPTDGTQYFDVFLQSTAPESGIGYTWFDNVGIIEWEAWQPFNNQITIPTPNDYYWIQIRTDELTEEAILSYQKTAYNPQVSITGDENEDLNFGSLKCFPNPFSRKIKISWLPIAHHGNASNPQAIEIQIYDIMGSLVKSHRLLVPNNCFVWDGKDNQGKILGSGIYFCRLQANGYEELKKIVLLK